MQVAVITADHHGAIASAQGLLSSARNELAAAVAWQAGDQAAVQRAAALVGVDQTKVASGEDRLATDSADRDAATAAVGDDRRHLRAVAVELYVDPQEQGVTAGPGGTNLQQAQRQMDGATLFGVAAELLIVRLHDDVATERAAVRAVTADAQQLAADQAALADVLRLRDQQTTVLVSDASAVAVAGATVARDQAAAASASTALAAAIASIANPAGVVDDGSPTIVGAATLSERQMVDWYDAQGYSDTTPAPVPQLVGWYLTEGAAEGVRGDLAFAQAVVETGGFSSPDAVTVNNYAGIGHCDSCTSGLAFPSPQLGVRAQVQLLHSYADGPLTATQLANPLVVAALAPQLQPDKGCCQTWQSLTGKWASDPSYGHTILSLYRQMLAFALTGSNG